ncbi:MAG: group III truncated hemoglobin [bacterium]|nr:group III truncated hemoglobin [bacterium]
MNTIKNREDVSLLVHTFYGKIRKDELLGPIFNYHIAEEEWPVHLNKLTNFWETNLFGVPNPKVSPGQKHMQVDAHMNYSINENHFRQWLGLWFETIDELFVGDLADRAKQSSLRMANGQFAMIWNNRPEDKKQLHRSE